MHYYKFNIGDYASHTQHLEPLEDIAYRRMLDWIYLHESPLPDSPDQIARLIRMRTHCEDIANVLREFFTLTDHGWMQEKASVEIDAYKDKSSKAKASAAARWAKKPTITDANALQITCESNANHKPLNTNQETLTNNQEQETINNLKDSYVPAKPKPLPKFESDDLLFAEKMFERLLISNPNHKKPNLDSWAGVIRKTRTIDERSLHDLWACFDWANKDDFWSDNILSPLKLRKHFDTLFMKTNKQAISTQPRDLSPLGGNY